MIGKIKVVSRIPHISQNRAHYSMTQETYPLNNRNQFYFNFRLKVQISYCRLLYSSQTSELDDVGDLQDRGAAPTSSRSPRGLG